MLYSILKIMDANRGDVIKYAFKDKILIMPVAH